MSEKWEALRDAIVGSIRSRTKGYLEANKEIEEFVVERTGRLARLLVAYEVASAEDRPRIQESIDDVELTIRTELDVLLVHAKVEGKQWFHDLFGIALDFAAKALPTIIAAL